MMEDSSNDSCDSFFRRFPQERPPKKQPVKKAKGTRAQELAAEQQALWKGTLREDMRPSTPPPVPAGETRILATGQVRLRAPLTATILTSPIKPGSARDVGAARDVRVGAARAASSDPRGPNGLPLLGVYASHPPAGSELRSPPGEPSADTHDIDMESMNLEDDETIEDLKISALEERNAELQKKNVKLSEKCEHIEEARAGLAGVVADREMLVAEFEKKNAELAKQNAKLEKKNADLGNENTRLRSSLDDIVKHAQATLSTPPL